MIDLLADQTALSIQIADRWGAALLLCEKAASAILRTTSPEPESVMVSIQALVTALNSKRMSMELGTADTAACADSVLVNSPVRCADSTCGNNSACGATNRSPNALFWG